MVSNSFFNSNQSKIWPWLTLVAALGVTVLLLRAQGRLWICACGRVYLWAGDIWSSDNSQHLADPYSFTHLGFSKNQINPKIVAGKALKQCQHLKQQAITLDRLVSSTVIYFLGIALLHGVVFFWALSWLVPRLSLLWRLCLAVVIEALWEVAENSAFIIERYREATASLGYEGDAIVNSLGDILICAGGFVLVWYIGIRRSVVLFVLTELILIFWIRDSLILSVIMLISPIEAIKVWQLG